MRVVTMDAALRDDTPAWAWPADWCRVGAGPGGERAAEERVSLSLPGAYP